MRSRFVIVFEQDGEILCEFCWAENFITAEDDFVKNSSVRILAVACDPIDTRRIA